MITMNDEQFGTIMGATVYFQFANRTYDAVMRVKPQTEAGREAKLRVIQALSEFDELLNNELEELFAGCECEDEGVRNAEVEEDKVDAEIEERGCFGPSSEDVNVEGQSIL